MDGALTPSWPWKFTIPIDLQATLKAFVDSLQPKSACQSRAISRGPNTVNGRTYYSISNSKSTSLAAYYTFVDGYLLASSSQPTCQRPFRTNKPGTLSRDSETSAASCRRWYPTSRLWFTATSAHSEIWPNRLKVRQATSAVGSDRQQRPWLDVRLRRDRPHRRRYQRFVPGIRPGHSGRSSGRKAT